ncbi:MAG TPA: LTA synthase family protein, partial [Desulfocapsa sulfexigens]|nr:LTA synthase family protein [Desulfocapsa sulfexigens]
MIVDAAFISVLVAVSAGLVGSVAMERLMMSSPSFVRPWSAWMLHGGLWLLAYSLITLLFGRPWFATAAVSAFLLMLVLVNNAKEKALREPFIFQDYEYFTDMIRHPRL